MKSLACLLMLLSPLVAADAVYKCIDDNGRPRFSQQPCGDDAETVTIETPNAIETQPVDEGITNALTRDRHLRELDAAIRDKGYALDQLQRDRDRELAELESRRSDAGRYLVLWVTDNQLDEEIRQTRERYRQEIARVERERDSLIRERQQLAAQRD